MAQATLQSTLRLLVESKKYSSTKEILKTMNPADIAEVFNDLDEKELPIMFRLLSREEASETFIEMDPDKQEMLIKSFTDQELKLVLDDLYADDAADLVEEMPANVVRRILAQADPSLRQDINKLMKYPDDSAGTVMTTEFIKLKPEMTVAQALEHIRNTGTDKETIYTCYVSQAGKLVGIVSAKHLLVCKDMNTKVSDIMDTNVISVTTLTDREEVARMFQKYNFIAMPVVDTAGGLAGIITIDDVIDVMEQEATEDMTIMSGQTPYETTYDQSTPWDLFLHRIPWLLILMISATFTGMIISNFEDALAAQVVLTAFIPMLMDTGGNSGSQSSVTIIRAISLGEVEFKDLPKVIWKEIRTAVLCGVALSVACFAKIMLVDRLLLRNPAVTLQVALCVCLTMAVTVLFAKIIGCTMPMIAKKLGFDPAVMASPLITTVVDAVSLIVYFVITTHLLF